jgi:hypothetical protein
MLQNLPDLGLPIPGVPGIAYRAFDRDGVVIAIPDRLILEAQPDGTPSLLLTLIRGGGTSATTGGRLELGLSIESDLEGIGRVLIDESIPASVAVVDFESGVLTVEARLGPVAPVRFGPPLMLPPDLLTRARIVVELSADAAAIASKIVEDSTLPVDAVMRVAFRAVPPRIPLALKYDPRAVAERIAARGEMTLTPEDFDRAIDALLAGPEITCEGDPEAIDPVLRARAVGLRLRDRFAVRTESDAGFLQLIPPDQVPSGHERIDMAEPSMVVVERSMMLDPLSEARSMRQGNIDDLVRRIEVPPVPTGRQRVSVSANLPEPVAGLQALVADLNAPAVPPFRPVPFTVSASLDPPDRRHDVELRLSPGEPLNFDARLRAVVARNDQLLEITGPWRTSQRSSVLLGSADFGAPLLVVRASRALTALAVLDVMAGDAVITRLDGQSPVAAIPMTGERMTVVARPLGGGLTIEINPEDKKRLDLDVATLPGFGAHRAQLRTAESKPILVEWRPEGEQDVSPQGVRMGPDRSAVEIGWIAASPFRPGMLWRVTRGGSPGPWSEPVLPRDALVIDVDGRDVMENPQKSRVIDGIELKTKDASGRAWTYVPVRPSLQTNETGVPMLQVIEAGPVAFLQCTARVALNEDARAALLANLRKQDPEAETLEPAPLSVERIALEAKTTDEWKTIAESKGSGSPPWTAALSVSLAPDQLAAIRSASEGEKDRARLVARMTLQGAPASYRRTESAADARIQTPAGTASAGFAAAAETSSAANPGEVRNLAVDLADCLAKR